jgi:hypothetical protein
MRNKWYADNRDLVKWSVLLVLARKHKADRILQIAYYCDSDFGEIDVDGHRHQVPPEVLSHFRDIRNVAVLCQRPRISVFDTPFGDRTSHLQAVKAFIGSFSCERCLVFLDPDTGLEPRGTSGPQHVLDEEARSIWTILPSGWVYVFYQHQTNKAGKPWMDEKRLQFAKAIGVAESKVGVASGQKIAPDVVFFHASKA